MNLDLLETEDRIVLRLSGRLDRHAVGLSIAAAKAVHMDTSDCIEVDLAGVDYIDIIGFAKLIHLNRLSATHGKRLILANAQPKVDKTMRWLKFTKLLRQEVSKSRN